MHKTLHGAMIGLLFGIPMPFLVWAMFRTAFTEGGNLNYGGVLAIILISVIWGAILGTVLPKHK